MKYYKALERNQEGELVSGCTFDKEWQVKYPEPGDGEEWAEPRVAGSKLFVCTHLDSVMLWSSGMDEVWRVDVEGVEPLLWPVTIDVRLWQAFWEKPEAIWGHNKPLSTVLADRVLLIERIGADNANESTITT